MTGWKAFFWAAAVYNLLIGFGGLVAPAAELDARMVAVLVFAFGIVYACVARDPFRYAPVLWSGVFGKVCIVALLLPGALADAADRMMVAILLGDVAFTVGFLAFLLGPAKLHQRDGGELR